MGNYLNPGNSGFAGIRNDIYVDKSGLIGLINQTIDTPRRMTCVSRPRRFGKSFAAQMLCAYYDKTCDSAGLFDGLEIADDVQFRDYLNRYDVIYLDMTGVIGETSIEDMIPYIQRNVTLELKEKYPELKTAEGFTATYRTGILPIKKDGSQSAISDFQEYSMLKPRQFAKYAGFTEEEVRRLCRDYGSDFEKMKRWYDGYFFRDLAAVYNPNSVMKAIRNDDFDSYWTQTSAAESLMEYISLNFDGLSRTVAELIGGAETKVDTKGFANDLVTFRDRNDVLTLLIHLGYLAYDDEAQKVRIPNEEVRLEFARAIRQVKRDETIRRVRESEQLIMDTVHQNEEAVARQIEKIHEEESPLYYNNEQALRSVIKRAYFSYGDEYVMFEELPAGVGYADIVYLPKRDSLLPVLIVELKWNQSGESALEQIKDRRYPAAFKSYRSDILLVGISYDREAAAGKRKHQCRIEKYRKLPSD